VLADTADSVARLPLQEARDAIRRASLISRQLLGLANPGAETPVVEDAGLAVERTIPMLKRLLQPGTPLIVERPQQAFPVELPATGFDQILLNLVANARDAIDHTGRIDIVVRRGGSDVPASLPPADYVAIDVVDDGHGIPASLRPQVTEPFFTTRAHGTGLGLAIVGGLVQRAGGALDLGDVPEGGTRATVYLPMSEKSPVISGGATPAVLRGNGEVVLVVDDDPVVRGTIALLTGRGGYTVVEAQSAWDALEALRTNPAVRLVMADVRMPVMSGAELLHAVRSLYPSLPVLLMSGYSPAQLDEASRRSADGFLLKPFEHRDLLQLLAEVLERAPGVRG
jgi:two-component system, cell cycle sensor histidine kinase and response regulator CckA